MHRHLFMARSILQCILAEFLARVRRLIYRILPIPHGPFVGDERLHPGWFTALLLRQGVLQEGQAVQEAVIKDLSGNRGFSGAVNRVHVTYRGHGTPPPSFIIKLSGAGIRGRVTTLVGGRQRESWFFETPELTRALQKEWLPRAYYSYGSSLFAEAVLLMEDLASETSVGVNMVMGNQVWGLPKPVPAVLEPVAVLGAVFTAAATMHAANWNNRALLQMGWLKGVGWYHGRDRGRWEQGIARSVNMWANAQARADGRQGEHLAFKLSDRLRTMITKSHQHTSWAHLQETLRTLPFTLCHGDHHASNMLLTGEALKGDPTSILKALRLLDWSELGPWEGPTELAQMMISDVKPAIFKAHSRQLVELYWKRLTALGVSAQEYPFEKCWETFVRGGMERWLWMFPLMASTVLFTISNQAAQYFHDQTLEFVEAFGADKEYVPLRPIVCLP